MLSMTKQVELFVKICVVRLVCEEPMFQKVQIHLQQHLYSISLILFALGFKWFSELSVNH